MYRECKMCGERMMIVTEGTPKYTHGSYIICGCQSCGFVEYSYDKTNVDNNPIQSLYDATNLRNYNISN